MLLKLCKHEMKASTKIYIIPFIVFAVLSVGVILFTNLDIEEGNNPLTILFGFLIFFYFLALVGIFLVPLICSGIRFKKNLFDEEGYLTNTLPVTANQLVLSKTIISTLWYIVCILFAAGSLALLVGFSTTFTDFSDLLRLIFRDVYEAIQDNFSIVILYVINQVAGLMCTLLLIFASLSLSQRFNKHRGLWTLLFIFVGWIIQGIISSIITFYTMDQSTTNIEKTIELFQKTYIFGIILSLIFGTVYYFLCYNSIKKHLNLQ